MNTESGTPRTDACWGDESCNILLHARQLEQELNALTSERNNLNASLTAAISSSNARHFESMEHEAKSKQLERELNAAMQALRDIYANEYNSSETYTICERILPKEEHLKP